MAFCPSEVPALTRLHPALQVFLQPALATLVPGLSPSGCRGRGPGWLLGQHAQAVSWCPQNRALPLWEPHQALAGCRTKAPTGNSKGQGAKAGKSRQRKWRSSSVPHGSVGQAICRLPLLLSAPLLLHKGLSQQPRGLPGIMMREACWETMSPS